MNTRFVTLNNKTLLKGDKTSGLIYVVQNFDSQLLYNLNSLSQINDQLEYIFQNGGKVKFKTINNKIFLNNLRMIDGCMPYILSEALLYSIIDNCSSLTNITNILEHKNPLNFPIVKNVKFYNYKILELIRCLALGLNSKTVWTGEENIFKHYPVLRLDNQIFYYIENINYFCETLLAASNLITYLGKFYVMNNELHFNVNFQIRLEMNQ